MCRAHNSHTQMITGTENPTGKNDYKEFSDSSKLIFSVRLLTVHAESANKNRTEAAENSN